MIRVLIFGASGYSGAELVRLVHAHPQMQLVQAYNSSHSKAADFSELHPAIAGSKAGKSVMHLLPATEHALKNLPAADLAFLALPHEVSAALAPILIENGIRVFDLSGAFRLKDAGVFEEFYGFRHPNIDLASNAFYCLMDWQKPSSNEWLCSIPGCYPTASSLALLPVLTAEKPLVEGTAAPVINAVSGVTGAGRKASLALSFAELSFAAYGVAQHRHTPEIAQNLSRNVQFTPHIAPFKRGLMATCTIQLSPTVNDTVASEAVGELFSKAYGANPTIRLRTTPPRIDDVVGTGLCDIHWQVRDGHLVVIAAIDNLLKGAASQALQAANVVFGFNEYEGIPAVELAYA